MDMSISKRYLEIAKINLKHNFLPHFLFSLLILCITPILFGISNLDYMTAWTPLELFVPLIGIVLLIPIFIPEQDTNISDIVEAKYTNMCFVYLTRIIYSISSILILIVLFGIYMNLCNSEVSLLHIMGAIANTIFLGSLGTLSVVLTHNTAVSYMIPLIYYILNLFGSENFGNFYLFSGMNGSYHEKIWLLAFGILFIALSLIINRLIQKNK